MTELSESIVDAINRERQEIRDFLSNNGEISLQTSADSHLRKVLLLSAASYFEEHVIHAIESFAARHHSEAPMLTEFIRNKALTRQYFTLFDWDCGNANKFWSLFGISFKQYMKERLMSDDGLSVAVKDFLELGALRNKLVHQNFGSFHLEKTADEIFALYNSASRFVLNIENLLVEYSQGNLQRGQLVHGDTPA